MTAAISVMAIVRRLPKDEAAISGFQARKSALSVCANCAEAFRRRRYKPSFISKLTDCQAEAAETQVWLEFWWREAYITQAEFDALFESYEKIISQLVVMQNNANSFARIAKTALLLTMPFLGKLIG